MSVGPKNSGNVEAVVLRGEREVGGGALGANGTGSKVWVVQDSNLRPTD